MCWSKKVIFKPRFSGILVAAFYKEGIGNIQSGIDPHEGNVKQEDQTQDQHSPGRHLLAGRVSVSGGAGGKVVPGIRRILQMGIRVSKGGGGSGRVV